MKPHILFLNGRLPYPFGVGGDVTSIDTFLSLLANKGYNVDCHGVINKHYSNNSKQKIIDRLNSKKINFIEKTDNTISYKINYPTNIHQNINLEAFLRNYIAENPQTVLLTQLDMAREILDISRSLNIPTILFIHDAEENNYLTMKKFTKKENKVWVIFNSNYTYNKFKDIEKYVPVSVIYPPIDLNNYQVKNPEPKYITMINPVINKGGKIFYEIVKNFPEYNFLAVKAWYDPIEDGLDFTKLPNVTVLEKQEDMRNVYSQTKLLLVPSQWKEGFGRVAAEGLIAGIPVLASKNAGLVDALGEVGFYVEDFKNTEAWYQKIKQLIEMKPTGLKEHIQKGLTYGNRFDAQILTDKLESIINKLC